MLGDALQGQRRIEVAGNSTVPDLSEQSTGFGRRWRGFRSHVRFSFSFAVPGAFCGGYCAVTIALRRLVVIFDPSEQRQRKAPYYVAEVRNLWHPFFHRSDGGVAESLVCGRKRE